MQFSESLKKNHQFQFVYKYGKSYANKYLVMYIKENGTERNRLGISVSKKVGNSVVRHRVTRLGGRVTDYMKRCSIVVWTL